MSRSTSPKALPIFSTFEGAENSPGLRAPVGLAGICGRSSQGSSKKRNLPANANFVTLSDGAAANETPATSPSTQD